jgi:hypothetical protein
MSEIEEINKNVAIDGHHNKVLITNAAGCNPQNKKSMKNSTALSGFESVTFRLVA